MSDLFSRGHETRALIRRCAFCRRWMISVRWHARKHVRWDMLRKIRANGKLSD